MANPAPTINQINAFNATQGTTIDFNIIGGTELVRSNKIYIYDLSDNSLICTHLYVSTESIHELPPNTDGSIVYESGKSSADFVNGKQYYAQIQTFTDIAGTQGGSGLSVSKLFWCLVDPSLTIDTIPSSISTTSYNVSATYDANTSVVSNIIQQYQFNLYSATGSLLQSSGVVVGNGEQQGTSTAYDISYNFSGLSVGSSYYVGVDVTTTQGMSVNAQSSTFTVSIDTPTLGEATVVNNACDGYISVTSNLSSEYGGSASGEIATFETDSVNNVTKLEVTLEPIQEGSGDPSPTNVRPITGHDSVEVTIEGKNLFDGSQVTTTTASNWSVSWANDVLTIEHKNAYSTGTPSTPNLALEAGTYCLSFVTATVRPIDLYVNGSFSKTVYTGETFTVASGDTIALKFPSASAETVVFSSIQLEHGSIATTYEPYQEPTTVSQSFNVTLTPTVIDETPYLFKKTGDVRGDRESLELVGGTVNWNQLVNFPNGSGVDDGITYTRSNGHHVEFSGTNTDTVNYFDAYAFNSSFLSNFIVGHKYLFLSGVNLYFVANNPYTDTIGRGISADKSTIYSPTGTPTYMYLRGVAEKNVAVSKKGDANIIDLTAFFGNSVTADYVYSLEQANAGAGIAWLRKYFPDLFAYSPYNTGILESVKPTAHVTRGVNQFDKDSVKTSEGAYILNDNGVKVSDGSSSYFAESTKVLPNTSYYVLANGENVDGLQKLYYFDANDNFISRTGYISSGVYTTPSNCHYIRYQYKVATVDTSKWCINISNPDINGQYFPYEKHTYPISELELRGIPKLVDGELRFDGDTRKADGSNNVSRKYTIIDLGTIPWVYNSTLQVFYQNLVTMANAPLICDKYVQDFSTQLESVPDKHIWNKNYALTAHNLCIKDSAYTDAETFKQAMSGHYVVFERVTPTTETADPFTDPQEVSIYGTEEFVSSNGVPIGNKTTYKTRDIFGGTIDLASGVLTVDKMVVVENSADGWGNNPTAQSGGYYTFIKQNIPNVNQNTHDAVLCNIAKGISYDDRHYNENVAFMYENMLFFNVFGSFATTTAELGTKLSETPLQIWCTLAEPLTYQLTPQQIETLIGTNNVWSNAGDVLIEFNIPITNLLVKRQDVADVSGNWLTLYSQPVEQASDMDFTFIDFLNQYGKTYKYALVPLLTQTQSGVEVEVEGGYTVSDEVQSIFDGVYIGDATGVQRLKAGVAYNNLNTNQQVGVIPTLGNKYPIIVSNSNIQYDTGSVSGLIVPDDFYSNGNLSRLDMSDKREAINDFITNKKPKILKDWNGNIWLVVFTDNVDVSFDNNYGMGVATFTSGWTEVGDPTNQEDLQRTGLINVGGD